MIAAALPGGAHALVATRSRRYRELGLHATAMGEGELLGLLAREPKLLRRPIVWDGRHAVVGADRAAIDALISPPADPPAR